ncbi:MAG: hypothetical protein H6740_08330 [Alphaproteobacteria bacterium]|nr:hypothetical protein [Alphaproteobacteria bacterium]
MSLSTVLKMPEVRALLREEIRAPGGWMSPKLVEPPRGNAPLPLALAFGAALRFGMAVRGWGAIRDLVALRALYRLRLDPQMAVHVPLARAQVDEAFAALARFDDGEAVSEDSARACFLLAGLEIAGREERRAKRVGALTRGVTREETAELQALYRGVPWARLAPTTLARLRPGIQGSPFGELRADLVIDDRLVGITMSDKGALTAEMLQGLVLRALLANRLGLAGATEPERVERVALYFARCGALRTLNLDACVHPAAQEDLLDEVIALAGAAKAA